MDKFNNRTYTTTTHKNQTQVGPSTWEKVFGARLPLGPTSSTSSIDAVVRQFNGYYGANLTMGSWSTELEDHIKVGRFARWWCTCPCVCPCVNGVVCTLGADYYNHAWVSVFCLRALRCVVLVCGVLFPKVRVCAVVCVVRCARGGR